MGTVATYSICACHPVLLAPAPLWPEPAGDAKPSRCSYPDGWRYRRHMAQCASSGSTESRAGVRPLRYASFFPIHSNPYLNDILPKTSCQGESSIIHFPDPMFQTLALYYRPQRPVQRKNPPRKLPGADLRFGGFGYCVSCCFSEQLL